MLRQVYAGALVGTLPDPSTISLSWHCIQGQERKHHPQNHAVGARRRGASSATDALIGTAILQPGIFAERVRIN